MSNSHEPAPQESPIPIDPFVEKVDKKLGSIVLALFALTSPLLYLFLGIMQGWR